MNKKEFLQELRRSLRNFGSSDVEGVIRYYDEIISDNIDAGLNEHNAVAALGDVRDIVACIKAEMVETNMTKFHRIHDWRPVRSFFALIGLCLTSPVLFAVGLALLISFIAILASFFAVAVSVFAGGIAVLVMMVVNAVYSAQTLGIAGILMSVGAGAAAMSVLCLLGIMFFKICSALVKILTRTLAKAVSKSRRRKINNERLG